MNIKNFIKKRLYLFWHIDKAERLSQGAIVEGVLNYGDFEDVKKLISILGIKRVASIFRKQLKQKRVNYDDKTINYFKLYFDKYA